MVFPPAAAAGAVVGFAAAAGVVVAAAAGAVVGFAAGAVVAAAAGAVVAAAAGAVVAAGLAAAGTAVGAAAGALQALMINASASVALKRETLCMRFSFRSRGLARPEQRELSIAEQTAATVDHDQNEGHGQDDVAQPEQQRQLEWADCRAALKAAQ
jgi:hypothetical protein